MSLTELHYFGLIERTESIDELKKISAEGDKLWLGSIRLRAEAKMAKLNGVDALMDNCDICDFDAYVVVDNHPRCYKHA